MPIGFSTEIAARLLEQDRLLFQAINQKWTNPFLDGLMPFISDPHPFLPFLAIAVVLLGVWGGLKGRVLIVLMLLALLIGDAGFGNLLKHAVHRPRPYQSMEGVRMVKREGVKFSSSSALGSSGNSFPSGHACNNIALAFMACVVYGRWASFLWIWALLMSYSRIYTGDHYPSDVAASWILSPLYCWVIVMLVQYLWDRLGGKYFPRFYMRFPNVLRTSHKLPC